MANFQFTVSDEKSQPQLPQYTGGHGDQFDQSNEKGPRTDDEEEQGVTESPYGPDGEVHTHIYFQIICFYWWFSMSH